MMTATARASARHTSPEPATLANPCVAHAGRFRFESSQSDISRVSVGDVTVLVDALTVAVRTSDTSDVKTHVNGPLAIACASRIARAPAAGAFAAWPCGRAIVWDGRLDNRDALRGQLRDQLRGQRTDGVDGRTSDADIVLAAYLRWGIDAFAHVIGDFAVVVWDPLERRVLLARDFAGVRPLSFTATSGTHAEITWSSDLECFLRLGAKADREAGARRSLSVNDAYLRHFMMDAVDHAATPFVGVYNVPPGTVVIAREDGSIRRTRCWRPDPHAVLRYRRDTDYQEHFLSCFREAVRKRLPEHGPVFAELSGGLDSSAIVCVADEILRGGGASGAADRFHTISYLPPDGAAGDERPYLQSIEQKLGRPALRLCEHEYSAFLFGAFSESQEHDAPNHDVPNHDVPYLCRPVSAAGRYLKVAEMMKARSVSVLLSGHAGDTVMWSTLRRCPHLADLLASLRFVALHRAIRQFDAGSRTYWNLLRHEAIAPLLPRYFDRPRIVAPYLVENVVETHHPTNTDEMLRGASPSRRMAYRLLQAAIAACSYHRMRTCSASTVDAVFPFLDRHVVQFMLAVPFDQKVRHGTSRWLLRRSLEGVLPEDVAARRSKASGQGFLCRAVNREWATLHRLFADDSRIAMRGLVRLPLLRDALERARRGLDVDALALTRAIAVETWLRQHETAAPRPMAVHQ